VLASPGANFLGRCFCLFLSGNVNNIWKLIKQRHYDCRQIWSLAHIRLNTHNPKPCVAIRNPVMTKACVYTYIYIYDYIYIYMCVYIYDWYMCVWVHLFIYRFIHVCDEARNDQPVWACGFFDFQTCACIKCSERILHYVFFPSHLIQHGLNDKNRKTCYFVAPLVASPGTNSH
jgi:hypothetical protein